LNEISLLQYKEITCTKCELHYNRIKGVIGFGNPNAKLMFVGEAGGREENEQGRPFVGKSGKLLTELMAEIGINREDVWITNTVKCATPENRIPKITEINSCRPFIEEEIYLVKPQIIILLGMTATRAILGNQNRPMWDLHGSTIAKNGQMYFITYHPSAVNYGVEIELLQSDFRRLKLLI
jgi:uracil-DNA glycosylase